MRTPIFGGKQSCSIKRIFASFFYIGASSLITAKLILVLDIKGFEFFNLKNVIKMAAAQTVTRPRMGMEAHAYTALPIAAARAVAH